MNTHELRSILNNFPKYPGTMPYPKASVVNDGFPGTFNLSFTEAEMLPLYGDYLNINRDLFYSKIQPVIRHNDWNNIVTGQNSYRYLGVFDLADVSGAIIKKDCPRDQKVEILDFVIKSFMDLIKSVDLNPEKIFVKYLESAHISDITNGKYNFNKKIPTFEIGKNVWMKNGITEDRLLKDSSRDSFLALKIFDLPSPWGYRNEIFYETSPGNFLDIGTVEWVVYQPIEVDGVIVDFKDWDHCFGIAGVGMERLEMAINGFDHIMECGSVKNVFQEAFKLTGERRQAQILTEAIRTIHRIVVDCGGYNNLSVNRKKKAKDYVNAIKNSKIHVNDMNNLLIISAESQNYYPELRSGVDLVLEIFKEKV